MRTYIHAYEITVVLHCPESVESVAGRCAILRKLSTPRLVFADFAGATRDDDTSVVMSDLELYEDCTMIFGCNRVWLSVKYGHTTAGKENASAGSSSQ